MGKDGAITIVEEEKGKGGAITILEEEMGKGGAITIVEEVGQAIIEHQEEGMNCEHSHYSSDQLFFNS